MNNAIEAIHAAICEDSLDECIEYRGQCVKAAEAGSEFIAAQAKAEALREAAEYIDAGDYADMNPDGTMRPRLTQVQISQRNRDVTARWLRARADTIEGKNE